MPEEKKAGPSMSEYDRTDLLVDFVLTYYDSMNTVHDYGTGDEYSMTEVHMVTRIADHPGITVTELARRGERTKSAISQVVKKLEEKGLVVKAKQAGNGSKTLLYVSPEGQVLSDLHKAFDQEHGSLFDRMLVEKKGEESVQQFYEVLACMNEQIRQLRRKQMAKREE